MTTASDVVRLTGPTDIAAAVPHLLGFVPEESLVALTVVGSRSRVDMVVRLDLPPERCDAEVGDELAARLDAQQADAVILAVFTGAAASAGRLPREPLVRAVAERLTTPVRDSLCISHGRCWSYCCDDEQCCPPDGRLLDVESPGMTSLAAAHALHGRAVLASREDLVSSIAAVTGDAAERMSQAIRAALTAWQKRPRRHGAAVRTLLDDVLVRYADPRAQLTDAEAATLQVGCHDIPVRDTLLLDPSRDRERMQRVMRDVVRRSLPPLDAPALSVFAWLAYESGDGVLVAAALDRAFDSDPDHGLAGLVGDALASQVPPEKLRGVRVAAMSRVG